MGKKFFSNGIIVAVLATFCCALWGSATPFIKIGYELIIPHRGVASTILFAGTRFMLAGVLTILIYSIARRKFLFPKRENWGRVLTASLFQTVLQYFFFYIGLSITTGVKGTVLSGSNAFFALLAAGLIFRQEKLTVKKIVACIIGFAGVILINLNGLDFTMNLGDTCVILSALACGVASVIIKRFSKYEDPVVISGYQFFVGGIVMMAVGALLGGHMSIATLPAAGVMIYLAFLSATAFGLWGVLLKYNSVSKVTIFNFLTPVFGVILSTLLLSENSNVPVLNLIITLLLICAGIFMINYQKEKKE